MTENQKRVIARRRRSNLSLSNPKPDCRVAPAGLLAMTKITVGKMGLLLLVSFLLSAVTLHAADDDIKVKASVDQAFLTIGDPVTYTVTVEHSPDIRILSRIPAPDSKVLEIKKIEDINLEEGKKIITGREFTVTTYRLGEFVLDPVTIKYQKDGGPEKTLETNKIYLKVKSIAEGEPKEDIRDVKSVIPLSSHFGWILILLGIAVLAFIAFLIYRKFRKKEHKATEPESLLSPEEQALKDLMDLFDSDLLKRDFVKLYYLRLSEILRVYLEKRYGILAVESTTFEIMRALKGTGLPKGLNDKIQYVLGAADLAKFAKWIPSPAENTGIRKKSEELVRESSPAVPPSAGEVPHGV